MNTDTDLVIVGRRIPAASMRGLKGDITPIANGVIIEMLDGSMRDQTVEEARKFEISLSCEDVNAPPVWGLWVGSILEIDFPLIIAQPVGEEPLRPAAAGSVFYTDAEDNLEVPEGDPRAAWRNYKPHLRIMLSEPWKLGFDEWSASTTLSLKGREA